MARQRQRLPLVGHPSSQYAAALNRPNRWLPRYASGLGCTGIEYKISRFYSRNGRTSSLRRSIDTPHNLYQRRFLNLYQVFAIEPDHWYRIYLHQPLSSHAHCPADRYPLAEHYGLSNCKPRARCVAMVVLPLPPF